VVLGVRFVGFFGVVLRVQRVSFGDARVVCGFVVVAGFVMVRGVLMMRCGVRVMLRCLLVVLGTGMDGHTYRS
jgi:hypothetical protein